MSEAHLLRSYPHGADPMFIPGHLIIEDQRRRNQEQQEDRRIPLYAPQPLPLPRAEAPERQPHGENFGGDNRRGAIIIDLHDYSEIKE